MARRGCAGWVLSCCPWPSWPRGLVWEGCSQGCREACRDACRDAGMLTGIPTATQGCKDARMGAGMLSGMLAAMQRCVACVPGLRHGFPSQPSLPFLTFTFPLGFFRAQKCLSPWAINRIPARRALTGSSAAAQPLASSRPHRGEARGVRGRPRSSSKKGVSLVWSWFW